MAYTAELTVRGGTERVRQHSSTRLWEVLVSFDSGVRSQRAQAASPPRQARDTVETRKCGKHHKNKDETTVTLTSQGLGVKLLRPSHSQLVEEIHFDDPREFWD